MKAPGPSRRQLIGGLTLVLAPGVALAQPPQLSHPVARTARPLRIGVIGAGRIGGTYGHIWSRAGHQVMVSDRDAATARAVAAASPGARAGTPAQAAAFGEVVLIAVPYGAIPSIARDHGGALRGKVVIDTANPIAGRDGPQVAAWQARGAGLSTAALLPGARVVRAFNILSAPAVPREAGRPGARVGIPIGGDDGDAVQVVAGLVRDAGFEPVVVPGGLPGTRRFDLGPPLQARVATAAEVRRLLGLRS